MNRSILRPTQLLFVLALEIPLAILLTVLFLVAHNYRYMTLLRGHIHCPKSMAPPPALHTFRHLARRHLMISLQ